MNEEFAKSFEIVKDDYLLRVRFQASLQAKINADHENYENWKRLERKRRADVMDWIEVTTKFYLHFVVCINPAEIYMILSLEICETPS